MTARDRILGFVVNPSSQPQNVGIKAAAWKFVQKVLVAGTRGGNADPRVGADPLIAEGRAAQLTQA